MGFLHHRSPMCADAGADRPQPQRSSRRLRGPPRVPRCRSGRWPIVVAAIGFLLAGASCTASPTGPADLAPDHALVVDVIDGDTIDIDLHGRRERVRLLGIDAPESVHPSVPIQCFGPEASAELARALPPSSEVRIERDVEPRDRYNRLLLYVYRVEDNLFMNRWLVRSGLADTSFYEPNTALGVRTDRGQDHGPGRASRSVGCM